jgi:hypothetical protein
MPWWKVKRKVQDLHEVFLKKRKKGFLLVAGADVASTEQASNFPLLFSFKLMFFK